jgi:hypothetical protein
MVLNTSFNTRGEPIVCTPSDALRCFMRTELDCLAIGSFYSASRTSRHWRARITGATRSGWTERRTVGRLAYTRRLIGEFVGIAREKRAYWIVPIVVVLGLAASFIVATEMIAPLMYALF